MKKFTAKKTVYSSLESELWGLKVNDSLEVSKEYFRNGETHYKGTLNGKPAEFPAILFSDFPVPAIEIYKGYEIRTTPNGMGEISLIYNGGDHPMGAAVSDLTENGKTSIEKAKIKIDSYPC